MIEQLKPAPVVRDGMGIWTHPQIDQYLEQYNEYTMPDNIFNVVESYFGIKMIGIDLEDDFETARKVYGHDDYDLSRWNPEPPKDYFLVSIHFTEDGASAWFATHAVGGSDE